jgi:teichuronic acid biosynthesis glycosyltransferase TuaC
MRVLFVSAGSFKFGVSPFIKTQGESLRAYGVDVTYFQVEAKGFKGYFNSCMRLRKMLKTEKFDIIHAHYTLSGWVAVAALSGLPVVLSLMGSDAYGFYVAPHKVKWTSRTHTLLTYAIQPFVRQVISKSDNIAKYVWLKRKSHIIPNGIQIDAFYPSEHDYRAALGLNKDYQYVLFLGKKDNVRKNFKLVEEAFNRLKMNNVELLTPYPIPHESIARYLNAVDVLVVPSLAEGSPNIVKEAMACNCPVVATDVGDVKWLFGSEDGYFIADFNPDEFAVKLTNALKYAKERNKTTGRNRLLELGLDTGTVAKRIEEVYKKAIHLKLLQEQ